MRCQYEPHIHRFSKNLIVTRILLLTHTHLVHQSTQTGIAEALLTCVFQGSVIWNSQMSPWQMNGEEGVVEMIIHALCRLALCVHQASWGLCSNNVALFGQHTGPTATQKRSMSTVTWPRFKPSSSSWRAADHTSNVRDVRVTIKNDYLWR